MVIDGVPLGAEMSENRFKPLLLDVGLCTREDNVIPVEVRAGTSGSLKSIQMFLSEKKRSFAVRFNIDRPSLGSFSTDIGGKTGPGNISFTLLSLPLYLAGQTQRLIREYFER